MVFSSLAFLLGFLPAVLLIYFISPAKIRNYVLLAFSLVFYAWGEPTYIILMLVSIAVNWAFALWAGKAKEKGKTKSAKISIWLTVAFNLAMLGFFKYADFLIGTAGTILGQSFPSLGIALPIGISFYTFQAMSYVIDVYRGDTKAQKNPFTLGTYVALFPQLIAGPIVRYVDVENELKSRKETFDRFGIGASRFVAGLGKKVLIANTAGQIFEEVRALSELSAASAWIGTVAYTVQIYFDFSGYSDMAIGLGHMFGFKFLENFNYPYIAQSITDFWRRWHISLSSWFRDYVYIPLGGNRKGPAMQVRNLIIVWLLTGIWHGAGWSFVLWGAYYAALLILEKFVWGKYLAKIPRIFRHVYTLLLVMVGWVLFSLEDITLVGEWLKAMFGFGESLVDNRAIYLLDNYGILLLIGAVCSIPWKDILAKYIEKAEEIPIFSKGNLRLAGVTLLFVISFAFLVSSSYNPFLYFRF